MSARKKTKAAPPAVVWVVVDTIYGEPVKVFHTRDAAEDWVGPCTAIYTIVRYARRPARAK